MIPPQHTNVKLEFVCKCRMCLEIYLDNTAGNMCNGFLYISISIILMYSHPFMVERDEDESNRKRFVDMLQK